jgi:uncharacterized protein YecE (DUF72 family)
MRILTGTSGWSYTAWRGAFYPPDLAPSGFLSHYAHRLETVEVNATFYRTPGETTLAAWRDALPAGFRMALKAPRRITHVKRLAGIEPDVRFFLDAAAALGPALGPVLFQLPPTLRKDTTRLRDLLGALPRGGRFAVEFRHPSWLADDALAALSDAGVALCAAETDEDATPLVPTAPFGYLRLRRASYSDADLAAWIARITAQPWREALAFFKHEDEARGPAFALRMRALALPAAETGAPA